MNVRLCRMLLLAMAASACHAAETLGYRFVADPTAATPVLECPVLAQAPAASPFAAAGDVLHDLTALVRTEQLPLADGWVLWNQTRRMLVIRGAMVDQWRIAEMLGFYRQDRHAKVTVEWLRAKDPATVATAPVFAAVGLTGNSGQKCTGTAKLETPDGRWKFSAEADACVPDDGVIDVRVTATWKGPGVGEIQHGSVCTSVGVVDGGHSSLAAWYAVGHGDAWQLRLQADVLLADGSCWRDARLRQVGEVAQAWRTFTPAAPDGTLPQGLGWQLGTLPMSADMIKTIVSLPGAGDGIDPFAAMAGAREYPKFDRPEAVIPDELKDFAAAPMMDLRQVPFMSKLALRPDVFLAYDPLGHRVVYGCKNRDVFDQIGQVFETCDDRWAFARNIEYETWLFDAAVPDTPWAKTSITLKSGQKAAIEWLDHNHRPFITLESEVSNNEGSATTARCDLRSRMKPPAAAGLDWHGNSTSNLARDVPLLSDVFKLPDGRTLRQGQRASVIQVRAE